MTGEQRPIFPYGEKEMDYLTAADPPLGRQIARLGFIRRELEPDPFYSLLSSIIGQQISNRAAAAVRGRFFARFPGGGPAAILAADPREIRALGLSGRKVEYVRQAALAFQEGRVDFPSLARLPDEEVISQLVCLPGVGRWTAEMLLIFSLGRPDVFSLGDYGIRSGAARLHGVESAQRPLLEELRRRYSPYGSIASFYLWALAGEAPNR